MPNIIKGGGGTPIQEPYSFPISMQTIAPTPINTNHIWIHNDRKMNLIIDEAVRSSDYGGGDCYYALVDSTDNKGMDLECPHTTTDNTHLMVVDRHIARDTAPMTVAAVNFAKKYGLAYNYSAISKWPQIYSRIGGVVDLEDAQRWDGSAWQWLSQKAHYLFLPNGNIANRIDGALSNGRSLQANGKCIAASPDRTYVAVGWALSGTGSSLRIFKRSGDSFTQVSEFTLPFFNANGNLKFSPDSQYLAAYTEDKLGHIYLMKKSSDGTWSQIQDLPFSQSSGYLYGMQWKPSGDYLFACAYSIVCVFKRSGDTFSLETTHTLDNYLQFMYVNNSYLAFITNVNVDNTNLRVSICDYNFSFLSVSIVSICKTARSAIRMLSDNRVVYISADSSPSLILANSALSTLASVSLGFKGTLTVTPDEKYVIVVGDGSQLNSYAIGASSLISTNTNTFDNSGLIEPECCCI